MSEAELDGEHGLRHNILMGIIKSRRETEKFVDFTKRMKPIAELNFLR